MVTRSRILVAAFAAGSLLAGCGDDTTSPTQPTHDLAAPPTGGNGAGAQLAGDGDHRSRLRRRHALATS
jgi:hypothetical protein